MSVRRILSKWFASGVTLALSPPCCGQKVLIEESHSITKSGSVIPIFAQKWGGATPSDSLHLDFPSQHSHSHFKRSSSDEYSIRYRTGLLQWLSGQSPY